MPDFTGFDPRSLLTTVVKGKLDTKIAPIPLDETDEFDILCTKVETRVIKSNKTGEQYVSLDTSWEVLDDNVKAVTHLEKPTARYSFILEVDPQRGIVLGEAKNVRLGRLLEAVGITSKEWSLSQIEGTTGIGKIRHRPDDDDPEIIYNEIVRVTARRRR